MSLTTLSIFQLAAGGFELITAAEVLEDSCRR
jgi:hypothetical protein